MPPTLFSDICKNLAQCGLATDNSRVVLEKPLGRDLASAKQINQEVGKVFKESQIFRIDHYLGKEAVQNLLALRFGNVRSEEHTSELQSLMRISYAVFCLKKKK